MTIWKQNPLFTKIFFYLNVILPVDSKNISIYCLTPSNNYYMLLQQAFGLQMNLVLNWKLVMLRELEKLH